MSNNNQLPTTLQFLRYSPDKILKVKITAARSKLNARSHHDDEHLPPHPPTPNGSTRIPFLHLIVSEIYSKQYFKCQGHYSPARLIDLFGVLRHFQHCTRHTMTGSWRGRRNQDIQLVKVLYCKLPTNGKQLPAFPLEAMPGTKARPQKWEARVLPLCHRGPYSPAR